MPDEHFMRSLLNADGPIPIKRRDDAVMAARLDAAGLVIWAEHRVPGSAVRGYAMLTDAGVSALLQSKD